MDTYKVISIMSKSAALLRISLLVLSVHFMGKDMKQILIIGNTGSGKTTFAKELSKKLNLPLVHLDKIYWCGEWEHLAKDEFDVLLQEELEKPEWIIDGNFNRTFPKRLKYCDTVFFFDFKVVACLWGITKRVLQNYGKTRDDMGGNCPEYFDKNKIELYKNLFKYNKNNRSRYYEMLKDAEVEVVVFKNRKDAKEYLVNL